MVRLHVILCRGQGLEALSKTAPVAPCVEAAPYVDPLSSGVSKMKMKLFLLFIIAILLVQAFAEASPATDASGAVASMNGGGTGITNIDKTHQYHPRKINCSYACARRCSKSSRKNVCHRACKTCCARCHCVPPGTYGNKSACPCYAKLKTHGNRPKCP